MVNKCCDYIDRQLAKLAFYEYCHKNNKTKINISEIIDILDNIGRELPSNDPTPPAPDWFKPPYVYNPIEDNIPDCCKTCSNHPANGGSGICNCVLPYMTTTGGKKGLYTTTATDMNVCPPYTPEEE